MNRKSWPGSLAGSQLAEAGWRRLHAGQASSPPSYNLRSRKELADLAGVRLALGIAGHYPDPLRRVYAQSQLYRSRDLLLLKDLSLANLRRGAE